MSFLFAAPFQQLGRRVCSDIKDQEPLTARGRNRSSAAIPCGLLRGFPGNNIISMYLSRSRTIPRVFFPYRILLSIHSEYLLLRSLDAATLLFIATSRGGCKAAVARLARSISPIRRERRSIRAAKHIPRVVRRPIVANE